MLKGVVVLHTGLFFANVSSAPLNAICIIFKHVHKRISNDMACVCILIGPMIWHVTSVTASTRDEEFGVGDNDIDDDVVDVVIATATGANDTSGGGIVAAGVDDDGDDIEPAPVDAVSDGGVPFVDDVGDAAGGAATAGVDAVGEDDDGVFDWDC
jgi:hypothetical protein